MCFEFVYLSLFTVIHKISRDRLIFWNVRYCSIECISNVFLHLFHWDKRWLTFRLLILPGFNIILPFQVMSFFMKCTLWFALLGRNIDFLWRIRFPADKKELVLIVDKWLTFTTPKKCVLIQATVLQEAYLRHMSFSSVCRHFVYIVKRGIISFLETLKVNNVLIFLFLTCSRWAPITVQSSIYFCFSLFHIVPECVCKVGCLAVYSYIFYMTDCWWLRLVLFENVYTENHTPDQNTIWCWFAGMI